MSHYDTLGVNRDATQEEIKRAFRKLASQHHPDKGGDTQKFQEIQKAYEILSDTQKKAEYDNPAPQGFHFNHQGGGMPPGMDDIFRQFGFGFGHDPFGQFRQQHQQQPKRNKDLRVHLAVPLVSTLEEQTKVISVQTTNGHRETVEVKIPRGITNGTTIKYADLGDNLFETIPRGDLLVIIDVHGADGFGISNLDLYTKIRVNCLLAVAGGTTTVTTLDGKTFELSIPSGVQPGVKFRIGGQGLYQMNSNNRGDLYAEMELYVPKDFTPDQLETVRSLINSQ
jgi:DnaJ-class molecular chaperone